MSERSDAAGLAGLSFGRRLAFALAGFPVGALSVALLVYLPPHLSGDLGVSLAVVGGVFATIRVLDVGIDPVLGLLMDRTRSPIGRYRLWMLVGAPIVMLGTWKLFMAPPGIGRDYLLVWLLVFYVGLSIVTLAHPAWASTLATRYHDRSRLYGLMAFAGVASGFTVLVVAIGAAQLGRTGADAVHAIGWLIVVITPILVLAAACFTREEVKPDRERAPRFSDYTRLITKRELVQLYLAQVFLTLGPGWMSSLYLFFARDVWGFGAGAASTLLAAYILAGLGGAPLTAHLATRIGKHRTLALVSVLYSAGLVAVLLVPRGAFFAALGPMLWCGFMAAGFDLMLRAMLADVADEVRLEQGKERTSLIFGLTVLAGKLATALSIGIAYPLLQALGYAPNEAAANTPTAIQGLKWAFITGPIVFVMLGGAMVLRWRLTAAEHARVRASLEDLDVQAALGAGDGEPVADAAAAARSA